MMKFLLHGSGSENCGLQAMQALSDVVKVDLQQRIQSGTVERTLLVQTAQIQEKIFKPVLNGCDSQQHLQDVSAHWTSSVGSTVRSGKECLRKKRKTPALGRTVQRSAAVVVRARARDPATLDPRSGEA